MTYRLLFIQRAFPRTTTRAEWRDIDRRRRVTEREIRKSNQATLETIRRLSAQGHVDVAAKLAEGLIDPPLMIIPELPTYTTESHTIQPIMRAEQMMSEMKARQSSFLAHWGEASSGILPPRTDMFR